MLKDDEKGLCFGDSKRIRVEVEAIVSLSSGFVWRRSQDRAGNDDCDKCENGFRAD